MGYDGLVKLDPEQHLPYVTGGLGTLPSGFETLDASRPWLVYWSLNALVILGGTISPELKRRVINTLRMCQAETGGFGGGVGQVAHAAPTYAAVNALAIIGTEEAWSIINREKLASWLSSLIEDDGSMHMHDDGEIDVRAVYCGASAARLCGLDVDTIFAKCPQWVARCQTYEGGFAAIPGLEAHGGYTFCGFAAMSILCSTHLIDIPRLTEWLANRQMPMSGGFQGRPNKLVDGCYSFWVGGCFPILADLLEAQGLPGDVVNAEALIDYVVCVCQCPSGFRDKPGKRQDYYHTSYCLSGLASMKRFAPNHPILSQLNATHPIHNVPPANAERMIQAMSSQTTTRH
ncbi:farnesyltransferase [Salpingoeca rosetta]|uniref:Protein farnesyltransferase subunit beta n=1 Tax=Salpingoeca rosetta (strain ATCC 50818 / BSB-021) TaxID=946362 RepID=F2UJ19_SALR5|nr:farnesyltransferase [Salpingoeca rosetta]EGD76967.1 farnesyltransferase [Salpingoeca rosetta]|eukprot:XP_004990807.1 farnesyltransferase [Salpingoeca rosetta]